MDTRQQVLEYFDKVKPLPGNSDDEKLGCKYLDMGIIDSMGLVTMIIDFEEMFGIHFEADILQSVEFETVGGVVAVIERLRREAGADV